MLLARVAAPLRRAAARSTPRGARGYGAGGGGGGDTGDVLTKPGGFFSPGLKESGGRLFGESVAYGADGNPLPRKRESWEVRAS